jgi:hypothetical protein
MPGLRLQLAQSELSQPYPDPSRSRTGGGRFTGQFEKIKLSSKHHQTVI